MHPLGLGAYAHNLQEILDIETAGPDTDTVDILTSEHFLYVVHLYAPPVHDTGCAGGLRRKYPGEHLSHIPVRYLTLIRRGVIPCAD